MFQEMMMRRRKKTADRTHTLTIHYVDYDDNTVKIFDDYVVNLEEGVPYSVPSPDKKYYNPNPSRVAGTMGAQDIVETVTYKRKTCNVLIQYRFISGGDAATAYSATVPQGEDFVVESPVIEGYTASQPTVAVNTSQDTFSAYVMYTPDIPDIPDDPL